MLMMENTTTIKVPKNCNSSQKVILEFIHVTVHHNRFLFKITKKTH